MGGGSVTFHNRIVWPLLAGYVRPAKRQCVGAVGLARLTQRCGVGGVGDIHNRIRVAALARICPPG